MTAWRNSITTQRWKPKSTSTTTWLPSRDYWTVHSRTLGRQDASPGVGKNVVHGTRKSQRQGQLVPEANLPQTSETMETLWMHLL